MANNKVLTIGDAMITMNPKKKGPLRNVTTFERNIGGAELNFAVGCARLGLQSKFISRIGKDEFGRVIYNFLRGEGIDTTDVSFVEGYPTSLNFKEINHSGGGKTFYYRSKSPILTLRQEDIVPEMLEGIDILHLSGVFLAIDPKNVEIVHRLMKLAKARNILISFDPNIRLRLWKIEEARKVFKEIFSHIDILLTGLQELQQIINDNTKESFVNLAKTYEIKDLVIKDGSNGSCLYRDGNWYSAPAYPVHTVDAVGAGDGFDAGFIYGLLNNFTPENLLRFANCVGAIVTTVVGDNEGLPYLDEVKAMLNNEDIIER